MKILTIENMGFDICDDPVQTEQIINNNLLKQQHEISDEYVYLSFPIAWGINNFGTGQIQNLISNLNNSVQGRIIYVCQHINVKDIDFGGNMVFTPHATEMDSYIAIPHHAPNKTYNLKDYKDRKYLISFVGSYSTHHTRKQASDILQNREDCFFRDTGSWHFYKRGEELKDNSNFYINNMNDSKISLCPRGTGPSTIRMWEAMAMGSVPMIISDSLKMPLSNKIDWKEAVIFVPESDILNIENYIPDSKKLVDMSEKCIKIYKSHFSENVMHKIITGEINDKI